MRNAQALSARDEKRDLRIRVDEIRRQDSTVNARSGAFYAYKKQVTRASKFQRRFTDAVTNEPVVIDKFIHKELLGARSRGGVRDESQAPGKLLERGLEPLRLEAIGALEAGPLVRGGNPGRT